MFYFLVLITYRKLVYLIILDELPPIIFQKGLNIFKIHFFPYFYKLLTKNEKEFISFFFSSASFFLIQAIVEKFFSSIS